MKNLYQLIALTISFVLFAFTMNAKSFDTNLPKGVVYQIEIGPMSSELPAAVADEFETITVEKMEDGSFKYYAGMFSDYESASIMENTLKFHGFYNSAVVSFFSGKSISLADAQTLQTDQNHYEEMFVMGESPTIDFNNPEGFGFNYSVHVDVISSHVVDNLLESTYGLKLEVNPQGGFVYNIGHISRMEEAMEILKEIKTAGANNAFLVAYFNEVRISTTAAADMERKFDEYMAEAR